MTFQNNPKRKFLYPVWFHYPLESGIPAAAVVVVYRSDGAGATATVDLSTLTARQGLAVSSVSMNQAAAGLTSLHFGADGVTTRIRRGTFAANGGIATPLLQARYGPPQGVLKVTSAVAVDVCGEGWIYEDFD